MRGKRSVLEPPRMAIMPSPQMSHVVVRHQQQHGITRRGIHYVGPEAYGTYPVATRAGDTSETISTPLAVLAASEERRTQATAQIVPTNNQQSSQGVASAITANNRELMTNMATMFELHGQEAL